MRDIAARHDESATIYLAALHAAGILIRSARRCGRSALATHW
jgi:hypothetical protein